MNEALESLGRIRAKGVALLAVVFLVGLVVGVAGDRAMSRRPASRLRPCMAGPRRPGSLPGTLECLNLNDAQRQQLRGLFDKYRPVTDSIIRPTRAPLRALEDSLNAQVTAVLTPAQRDTLAALQRELAAARGRARPTGFRVPGLGRRGFRGARDSTARTPSDSR